MQDRHECKQAVHELCLYIIHQCERPKPQHKKDLHSMIVTAFHTLAAWLLQHPYLMNDKVILLLHIPHRLWATKTPAHHPRGN